jgi:hypothetical protein
LAASCWNDRPIFNAAKIKLGQTAPQGVEGDLNPSKELSMANCIAAHKHRTRLHILRDRLKRAMRDAKRGLTGAAERVAAHRAKREQYRAANP